jgi:endogenous inhibitor of DNA gyrase (YacG/DUF329 family)
MLTIYLKKQNKYCYFVIYFVIVQYLNIVLRFSVKYFFFSCCSSISSVGSKSKNNNSLESFSRKKKSTKNDRNGKIPTVPCPYCGKQCSYLNKHIRDVHQPKVHCPVCGKRMGKSYLSEHMKIQHQGKEVPTKVKFTLPI